MSNEQNQPREYDAVLGSQNSTPVDAAVLGGIAGVKSRLASPAIEVRIAALSQALKYGDAGLDLIIGALRDESMQVKLAAYSLLKDRDEENIKQQLQKYLSIFDFDVITVDLYGKENSRTKFFAGFFHEDLGKSIVLEMVYIPAGSFQMGSSEISEIKTVRQVTVQPFYLGKYPVTQAQWETIMGNNPSHFKGAKRPVEQVNWDEAVEFCRKLSEKTGKTYRLPSEAEWEYACCAGTTTPFYFGDTITPDLINCDGNRPYGAAPEGVYRQQTTDVGSFPPNSFGLYDMHGNVWEWCSDEYYHKYSHILIDENSDESSWETGISNDRVRRGGSWGNVAVICRSANREYISPDIRDMDFGFRVALVSA